MMIISHYFRSTEKLEGEKALASLGRYTWIFPTADFTDDRQLYILLLSKTRIFFFYKLCYRYYRNESRVFDHHHNGVLEAFFSSAN